ITRLTGIAFRPTDGALFGLTTQGSTTATNALFRIDPITGASTLVGQTGLSSIIEGDLAFDPTSGLLYGVQNLSSPTSRHLFTIHQATGVEKTIGSVEGDGDLSGIAFDSAGNLFILDDDHSLSAISQVLRVDKSNAAILDAVPLSLRLGPLLGMDFDRSTGVLY